MRKLLAIITCKLAAFAGRLLKRGSSLPGGLALKICPDILSRLALPNKIIAVTGSNGKTSTVELLAAALARSGLKVVWNREGSNQTEGVATMLLRACTLSGKVRCDAVVMESDEQYARHTFRHIRPTHFAVLNLCRDQLTRNGHPEYVFERIAEAVTPGTMLVLNADDPLTASLSTRFDNPVTWFGINPSAGQFTPAGVYDDGKFCPLCGGEQKYSYRTYSDFGGYACTVCCYSRPVPDFAITALDLSSGSMTINGQIPVETGIRTLYSAYNTLAAFALACLAGLSQTAAAAALSGLTLKSGRLRNWDISGKKVTLLTSKHENSVSYNESFSAAAARGGEVLVLVDAVSRKYFTSDTSWLYDIDFSPLASGSVTKIWLCGKYLCDLRLRAQLAGIPEGKIEMLQTLDDIQKAFEGASDLYVCTCFADRDKFLSRLPAAARETEGIL